MEVGVGLELLEFLGAVLGGDVQELVGEAFVDLSEFLDREEEEVLSGDIRLAVLLLH